MNFANTKVIGTILALLFHFPFISFSEEPKTDTNRILGLRDIKCFSQFAVIIGEDGKKLGLDEKALNYFLLLQYKNNFAKFPGTAKECFKPPNFPQRAELAAIEVSIITVVCGYLVAYYMEMEVYSLGAVSSYLYKESIVGYCSKKWLVDEVKKSITELIQEFAIVFFKQRAEL